MKQRFLPLFAAALAAAQAWGAPLAVTDDLGRAVSLAAPARRIVSLAPSNTEILFAVGAGPAVVGVTTYCNWPAEVKGRETVGGFSAKSISVEKIVSLKPDLVLAAGRQQAAVYEPLERMGIPVAVLAPRTVPEVAADIRMVGLLAGREKEGGGVADTLLRRVEAVTAKLAGVPQEKRPRVFWEIFDEPLMTAGVSTFPGQILALGGGVNVFSDAAGDYPQVSVEQVVARNPAVIMGPDSHGEKMRPEQVAARPGWGRVDAVRNRRIHLIDGDVSSRAGPRLADAVEAVARILHPDLFR